MTYLFSAPGRTEICGNHTDHQHGCVLAASVGLETTAEVRLTNDNVISVLSEGYSPVSLRLSELDARSEEKNTPAALVRGVAAAFARRGARLHGFEAQVRSAVLPGSGLSSSASFEVLLGTVINHLFFQEACTPMEIAQIGQWAENVYFGKPCGLMDQAACALGGLVYMDFADPTSPVVKQLSFDLSRSGYALCIIDSGAAHSDLTDEYAAIRQEMCAVAALCGKEFLRDVDETLFFSCLPAIRQKAGDRAVLRAMHFFAENRRVALQVRALQNDDFDAFLRYVNESGRSSCQLLQNITPYGAVTHQEIAVTLALADKLLGGHGAVRVHGGGFAGTVQAFVPEALLTDFCSGMDAVLGDGRCRTLSPCLDGARYVR